MSDYNFDQAFRQIAAEEPEELRKYIFIPKPGQAYANGTSVPLLNKRFKKASLGTRSIVIPSATLGPQPFDYVRIYLTISQYLDLRWADVLPRETVHSELISYLRSQYSTADYLFNLAVLNHLCAEQIYFDDLLKEFSKCLNPRMREKLVNIVRSRKERYQLIARQPLLHAMRVVLTTPEPETPRKEVPLFAASILLSHTVADSLYQRMKEESPQLPGINAPAYLALEMIQNMVFNESQDILSSLERNASLWQDYGRRITKHKLRRVPAKLFRAATGVDFEDFLALGLGVYSHVLNWGPEKAPKPLSVAGLGGMPRKTIEAFIKQVAASPEELRQSLAKTKKPWDLLAFQKRPIVHMGNNLIVLDEGFLLGKITTGLYWLVHDNEKSRSDADRNLWTHAFGEMIELMTEDRLNALKPITLAPEATAFYEEDAIRRAYKCKPCDIIIDYGWAFCLFEVVSSQLTIGTRAYGDVSAFEKDTHKIVINKAIQLDETCKALLANERPLTGISRTISARIFPVIIAGGGYPVSPMSMAYIQEILTGKHLLNDPRVGRLCIIELDELEMLEGLAENGIIPPDILRDWKNSDLHEMPLRNYLIFRFGRASKSFRPKRISNTARNVFDDAIRRLRLKAS